MDSFSHVLDSKLYLKQAKQKCHGIRKITFIDSRILWTNTEWAGMSSSNWKKHMMVKSKTNEDQTSSACNIWHQIALTTHRTGLQCLETKIKDEQREDKKLELTES